MKSFNDKIPVFKAYHQDQLTFLPQAIDDLIPESHPVRMVNAIIDELDFTKLIKAYKGGGTSSYHPKMMFKVIVFAYLSNITSTRRMEAALKENIHFMWISGKSFPDHNSLARFRANRLRHCFDDLFAQVVLALGKLGLVNMKSLYLDGTKFEANASKYSFVWGKAIDTNLKRMRSQIKEFNRYTVRVCRKEMKEKIADFEKIETSKVKAALDEAREIIEEELAQEASKENPDEDKVKELKKVKQKINYGSKNWPEKIGKYDAQMDLLDGRNSMSKTDPDATFMRMKDDHMGNGQLKAGYNLQISTNNQIVVNYSVHSNPTDWLTLPKHLEKHRLIYGEMPAELTADAGYGSEENYSYLEENNVKAYVKYSNFHREQHGKMPAYHADNFLYDESTDTLVCPGQKRLEFIEEKVRTSASGYKQLVRSYKGKECGNCPLKAECTSSKEGRHVEKSFKLQEYKAKARELLTSEEGIKHRKRRCCDVETIFGNLKQNRGLKRLWLRGKEKVHIELGLWLMSNNLRKLGA